MTACAPQPLPLPLPLCGSLQNAGDRWKSAGVSGEERVEGSEACMYLSVPVLCLVPGRAQGLL